MAPRDVLVTLGDLRGGRNGTDPPLALADNQAVEVLNMDWLSGTLGRKRGGADPVGMTGGTTLTAVVSTLLRHQPGATDSLAELWAFGVASLPTTLAKRLASSTSWADVAFDDGIASAQEAVVGGTLNGKLFLAYDSAVDRLHVYDPQLASPRVRRVGLATPAAPTVTDTGSGTYPITTRYVRVRWVQLSGTGVVVRRSEASPSTSFSPSGTGTAMRITRPTVAGEGETHWEIEVSLDDLVWFRWYSTSQGNQIAVATTTQDDAFDTGLYAAGAAADLPGTYSTFPSVRYLLSDGNRLLGAGSWESGKTARVYYTPVLGSTDQGDDERVPSTTTQKNWIDLNENDGGTITGLAGPIDGNVWAFKYRQIWKLTPTGVDTAPYTALKRTDGIGCIAHKSLVVAEDDAGLPALYFLSHKGPYRQGANGLQYLGRDNEDIWRTLSLEATVVTHAVWHADSHQVWFWIAVNGTTEPALKMVFDVKLGATDGNGQVRGGWAKHDGLSALARCSVMFSTTPGSSMTHAVKPYIGYSGSTNYVMRCDTTATSDANTPFQAYATSKPLPAAETLHRRIGTREPHLLAMAQAATSVQVTVVRDFGIESRAATVSLAPAASETRVLRKLEGLEMADAAFVQVTIGDASAVASAWTLDALAVPVKMQEPG